MRIVHAGSNRRMHWVRGTTTRPPQGRRHGAGTSNVRSATVSDRCMLHGGRRAAEETPMSARRFLMTAASFLLVAGCADDRPTSPTAAEPAAITAKASGERADVLRSIPVQGTTLDANDVAGTLAGLLNTTYLAFEDGQLLASGYLTN